jgi:hypothetical protein
MGGAAMTKRVKPTQLLESIAGERRDPILEGLRGVSADLGAIQCKVNAIGTALKAGKITAGEAPVAARLAVINVEVAPVLIQAQLLGLCRRHLVQDLYAISTVRGRPFLVITTGSRTAASW